MTRFGLLVWAVLLACGAALWGGTFVAWGWVGLLWLLVGHLAMVGVIVAIVLVSGDDVERQYAEWKRGVE